MGRSQSLLSRIFPSRKNNSDKPPTASRKPAPNYHAVTIAFDENACDSVKALADKVYLSAEAPPLPLTVCDNPKHCRCTYEHYEDRRRRSRRADGLAGRRKEDRGGSLQQSGIDERQQPGRRSEDLQPNPSASDYYEHIPKEQE